MRMFIIFLLAIVCSNIICAQSPQITFQIKPDSNGESWEFVISDVYFLQNKWVRGYLLFGEDDIPRTIKDVLVSSNTVTLLYSPILKKIPVGQYSLKLLCREISWEYKHDFSVQTTLGLAQQKRELSLLYEGYVKNILAITQQITAPSSHQINDQQNIQDTIQTWKNSIQTIQSNIEQNNNLYWVNPDPTSNYEILVMVSQANLILKLQAEKFSKIYYISTLDSPSKSDKEEIVTIESEIKTAQNSIKELGAKILKRQNLPQNFDGQTLQQDLEWFNRLYQDLINLAQTCQKDVNSSREIWNQQSQTLQKEMVLWVQQANDYRASDLGKKYQIQELNLSTSLIELSRNWNDLLSYYHSKINGGATNKRADIAIQNLQQLMSKLLEISQKEAENNQEKIRNAKLQIQKDWENIEKYWNELLGAISTQTDLPSFSQWLNVWKLKFEQDLPTLPSWKTQYPNFSYNYYMIRQQILARTELEIRLRQIIKDKKQANAKKGELERVQAYIIRCNWEVRLSLVKINKQLAELNK